MILSVNEIKELVKLNGWADVKIERRLEAIEQMIRAYTNNNFQNRNIRGKFEISGGIIYGSTVGFSVKDTIQITESKYNEGLFVIKSITDNSMTVCGNLIDERVLVTKVEYPIDVIDGVVNLFEWDVNKRGKVGIQSETLSRHSVSYFNMDGENSLMGYPKSLLGFLKPYRKARC